MLDFALDLVLKQTYDKTRQVSIDNQTYSLEVTLGRIAMHRLLLKQARSLDRLGISRVQRCTVHHEHSDYDESQGDSAMPFQWLKLRAPEFRVNGDQVTVLHNPSEFYDALKENIRISRKSVVLASLYLGNGPMEQELVTCMHEACERAHSQGDNLSVRMLLDCVRGSRGKSNSRTMLLPLLREFTSNVSISLYHTPELRGWKKALIPERFNEAIGLSHLKVYTFDDTLLMSGANLSEMYFTNRQDRYVLIRNAPRLVSFFNDLVSAISSLGFQLHPDDSLSLHAQDSIHPVKGDLNEFKTKAHRTIQNVLDSHDSGSHSLNEWHRTVLGKRGVSRTSDEMREHDRGQQIGVNEIKKESSIGQESSVIEEVSIKPEASMASEVQDERTRVVMGKAGAYVETIGAVGSGYHGNTTEHRQYDNVDRSIRKCEESSPDGAIDSNAKEAGSGSHGDTGQVTAEDTVIYPLVQMGPLGVTVDQEVTRQMLGEGDEASTCYLASGYFNLTSEYMETIVQSNATFEILMASPQVNGFYGSRGISGYIPDSYTYISRQFYQAVHRARQQRRIRLYEYYRDKWTFHVKGLWYYLPYHRLPSLTLIGSPNFGHRSVHRDLEAQLAIVTRNESLRNQLHHEQERLYDRSVRVSFETYAAPERRPPLWTRLVAIFARNFF